MSDLRTWLIACALCFPAAGAHAQRAQPQAAAPAVAGWIETAWLTDYGLALDAKLDTGAQTSSLDAGAYETFNRGGRRWTRFSLKGRDGRVGTIETPVLRMARIRRAGTAVTERPVISLALCVAGRTGEAEFTLADRTGMGYAMLIGRGFLAGRLVVDSGRTRSGTEDCAAAAGKR